MLFVALFDYFSDLRNKYGSPLVVINLVKRREKSRHESILHDQLIRAISYLNQFLPPDEAILYLSFDVARCNKLGSVMPKLEEIGYNSIVKQGWFQVGTVRVRNSLMNTSFLWRSLNVGIRQLDTLSFSISL